MKNYDVKASAIDLIIKSKITIESKRLAYLVPNMFNKITSGYTKKLAVFINSNPKLQAQINKVDMAENSPVAPPVNADSVVNNPAPVNVTEVRPTDAENSPVASVPKAKNYVVKVEPTDVSYLKNGSLRSVGIPRRLLISTVFVQKLISHRTNGISANAIVTNVEPVIPSTEVPKVEIASDPKAAGVAKYVELMNKRKEAIAIKQSCEKEMTELVNEFGITLDMVNAELAKGNNEK
jgi:hypothetical protein